MSLEENSWYCRNCTSVSLPYSNIEDDDLFTENLDLPNLSNNVKIIPSTRLKNIINECNKLTENYNDNINNEINEDMHTNINSKYYDIREINQIKHDNDSSLSIIHPHIASISKYLI